MTAFYKGSIPIIEGNEDLLQKKILINYSNQMDPIQQAKQLQVEQASKNALKIKRDSHLINPILPEPIPTQDYEDPNKIVLGLFSEVQLKEFFIIKKNFIIEFGSILENWIETVYMNQIKLVPLYAINIERMLVAHNYSNTEKITQMLIKYYKKLEQQNKRRQSRSSRSSNRVTPKKRCSKQN